METLLEFLDATKAWAFLVGAALLLLYPPALFAWMVREGWSAAPKKAAKRTAPLSKAPAKKQGIPSRHFRFLPILIISICLVAIALPACSFIAPATIEHSLRGREQALQPATTNAETVSKAVHIGGKVALAGAVVSASNISLWHDVDLFAKTWLDNDTELYRYVNEIPMGSLRKFEVQTHMPYNAISEDAKGSKALAAFGKPVPFNYGCFPQTFRDPDKVDAIYAALGDDDPLDILDLGRHTTRTGDVVTCRPLGAVCLIDEGLCDWKILAVNVDAPGALAAAHSLEDVERIAPGRTEECLSWIRELKCFGKQECFLHAEIHGADTAAQVIKGDHLSWQRLVSEVGVNGTSRGHWIRPPRTTRAMLP